MSHEVLDQQGLAIDRVIAERLRENPELLEIPRRNLQRWLARPGVGEGATRCYNEWLEILDQTPIDGIIELLLDDSENGRRLRQNSPFVGILTPNEVREIKSKVRNEAA